MLKDPSFRLISLLEYTQITRLIAQYRKTGCIKHHHVNRPAFQTVYSKEGIRLLARMDQRHDAPCGQALKKLCERAYNVFDEVQFKRLSTISVSHLYNQSCISTALGGGLGKG